MVAMVPESRDDPNVAPEGAEQTPSPFVALFLLCPMPFAQFYACGDEAHKIQV